MTSTTTLRQKAAGRYEGEFAASEEGAYLLRVQAREAGQANEATMGQTLGAVVPYSPEYRGSVRENGLLARLASITGGRVLSLDNVAAVLEHNIAGARTTRDLSPLLLVLAILLLPFDIGLRRVTVSRTDLARLAGAIRAALGRRQRRAVVGAGAASIELEALLGAKGRVRAVRDAERSSVALPRSEPAAPAPSSERAAPASRTDNGATRPHRASPPTRVEPTEQPDEALAARLRRARDSRR